MGQDSAEIRREIEETRARMGETVEAIGYKADVPSRMKDAVNEKVETVKGTIGDALGSVKHAVSGAAGNVTDSVSNAKDGVGGRLGDASDSAKQAVSMVAENPLGIALGALALGFLGGLLVPVSDLERERIGPVVGPMRDQLVDRAQTAVGEAVEAGKTVLNETLSSVAQSAQTHGKEIAQHAVAGTPLESALAHEDGAAAAAAPKSNASASSYANGSPTV